MLYVYSIVISYTKKETWSISVGKYGGLEISDKDLVLSEYMKRKDIAKK